MKKVPSKMAPAKFDIQKTSDILYLVRDAVKLLAENARQMPDKRREG